MVKDDCACLILIELNIHPQNVNLMHNLEVESNLITLFEAECLRVLQLQIVVILTILLKVELNGSVEHRSNFLPGIDSLNPWIAFRFFEIST